MSSNSWKKYGGISKSNDYNTLNASTIIADKFISRSVRPIYQYFNGTYEVAQDLSAGVNILAGNSTYTRVDAYINRNIYANNKIYFGGNEFVNTGNVFPELSLETTHAYFYGDASNIGVNTLTPKTIFNITGKTEEDTDILTVESANIYIRNILGQNKDARGVVLDANGNESNIYFYTDVSTNAINTPDANIKYSVGHVLSTTTENGITSRSRYARTDTSGGFVYFDGEEYRVDASVNIFVDSSSNIRIHADKNITIDAGEEYRLDASNGLMMIDDAGLTLSTDGTLVLNSSGGLIEVYSEETRFNALLDVAPPERGISLESLYNETLAVYDNNNSVYLKNVYNDDNLQTGNAITAIAKDARANTFIRMIAPINNRGSAMGGGVYPPDTDRSMAMFGLSDSSGSYIPSQMIVSSNSREKYASTLGINTYSPATEQYVLDVNGPMHVGNGEINTVAEANFEIKGMSFSKTDPNHGIAAGTSSTITVGDFQQYLLYTTDGGKTWALSDIYARTPFTEEDFEVVFGAIDVYNNIYAFVGGNVVNYAYITTDGGLTWVRIQGIQPILGAKITQTIEGEIRLYIAEKRDETTCNIFYTDISTNALSGSALNLPSRQDAIVATIKPNMSELTENYFYLVGEGGVIRYNRSTYEIETIAGSTGNTYNDIYAYDENNIVAVGNNIISYYKNGGWEHINNETDGYILGAVNLQGVFMYDADTILAVGASGKIVYTTTGPEAVNWKYVPEYILNTSGMKDRLIGEENDLRKIVMPDKNTFIIADVIRSYSSLVNTGHSKIQYAFLPNLLNREENVVVDVSGNMVVSGDVYINDSGRLYVDAITHLNGDVSMNSKLFVQDDVLLNSKLFVQEDVSLNSKLYVHQETIHQGDVSMNSRLFVQDDVSLNNNLFVQRQIIMPSLSNVLVNILDGNDDGSFYNTNPAHSKNIHMGGNTRITNIGPVDIDHKNASASELAGNNTKYINIGAINPPIGTDPVIIQIGNYSNNLGSVSNRIYIGGGNDEVLIAGNVQFTTLEQMRVNNPLIELNANENEDSKSAGSGIIIRDNSNSRAGFLLVSNNREAYNLQAPVRDSHPIAIETHQMNLANFTIANPNIGIKSDIQNGIVVLTQGLQPDASYSLVVRPLDISNILVRDSATSNDEYQNVLTNLIVQKDISLNRRLFVQRDASFNENVYIKQNLTVDGNLMVRQTTTNQYIINTTTTDYTLIVAEDLSLNGRMYVDDDVSLNANLYVNATTTTNGDVLMNRRLYVQGDVSLNAKLYVNTTTTMNGDVSMNSRLYVQDAVSLNANLYVNTGTTMNGDVSLNSRLYVQKDVSLNAKLYVDNATIMNGDVSMNSRLYVREDVSMNANLYVNARTTMNGDVSMNAKLYVDDASTLNGDVSMNSRLYVQGDVSLNANLYIEGDLSLNGNMYARQNIELDGSMNISGNVSIGKPASSAKLEVYRDAASNANNETTGTVFKSTYMRTAGGSPLNETGVYIGEYKLDVNEDRLDIPMAVYGNGEELLRITTATDSLNNRVYIQPWMGIGTDTPMTSVDISYTDAIRIPRGTTVERPVSQDDPDNENKEKFIGSIRYNTENSQFEGFGPGSAWGSLGGVINVAQNTKILASYPNPDSSNNELMFYTDGYERMRIYKTGDVSMNNHLFVHDDVSFNAKLYVDDATTLNGDVSMNSRLYVQGDVSLNSNVYITGKTTNNGDVSMNERLTVGQDASFNKDVYITGATITYQDISVNGLTLGRGSGNNETNSAFGKTALYLNSTGNLNTAVGHSAGLSNTTATKNTFIGALADLNSTGATWTNSTAIGYNAKITASNQIVLGTATETVNVPGSVQASEYTATSDYRIKENITPLMNENYNVDDLNPVSYFNKLTSQKDIGLIAHELQIHLPFLVNGEKDGQNHQSVNYIGLISLLIHEVQQLKSRVSELEGQTE